jgi:hypothetical protein
MRYYERHIAITKAAGLGFILESPTWRASDDWGAKLDYTRQEIAAANHDAIRLIQELSSKYQSAQGAS